MKHASITLVVLGFSLSGLFMACASGSETNTVGGTGTGGAGGRGATSSTVVGTTTSGGDTTSNTASTTVGGGQCVTTCKMDSECAGSCPAPKPGSSNCCDGQTNICYVSNTASCPTNNTTTGTGMGGSMY